jgi:serine/threonine-protein kinase HipA
MSTLTVYLCGEPVGTLDQDSNDLLRFAYAPEWLSRRDAVPLSRMLPLAPQTYDTKHARPFFAGILPEEGPRTAIARILGISEGNDFAMLERIGGECAGAVSLLPKGRKPPQIESLTRVLDADELVSIVQELPHRPLMAGEEGIRLSLAGAQNKLPVVIDGKTIALPLGNTPSTHIIKPEPEHFPGLVANEAFCMELARRVGLNVAESTIRLIGDTPCIVVTRYDRKGGADGTVRLHQEDCCQALGRPPERKYQQEGGPSVRECITFLREWSTTPVLDILAFVDALIFNMLVGNADAHGKNFSMIYAGGTKRLAPLYDLVSTIAWPELSTRLAMSIGHGKRMNDLNPMHFKRMAEECGVGWPMVRDRMRRLADGLGGAIATGVPIKVPMAAAVWERVAKRCERMTTRLDTRSKS